MIFGFGRGHFGRQAVDFTRRKRNLPHFFPQARRNSCRAGSEFRIAKVRAPRAEMASQESRNERHFDMEEPPRPSDRGGWFYRKPPDGTACGSRGADSLFFSLHIARVCGMAGRLESAS